MEEVTLGTVARLTWVSEDRTQATIQLADGRTGSIQSDAGIDHPVDTVLLFPENKSSPQVLSDEAVPVMTLIGVVRCRKDGKTLLEVDGKIERVPESRVDYAENDTVEFRRDSGVISVVDTRPIRFSVRDVLEGGVDAERYRVESDPNLSFDSFAGMASVKNRARELIEVPLEHQEALREIGARPIKGVIFTGDPGTGKTFLARIIAQQAEAAFYAISGPEIVSKWVGDSEDVLRKVFDAAKEKGRAIIFFDEFDSVAAKREDDSHEASKRLVAQLLTLMDGFSESDNVVVIAATNRLDDIDIALRRPGRFDWEIEFPLPGEVDRRLVLETTAEPLSTAGSLPHYEIAQSTEGWSPAELAAVWSEAALFAVVDGRRAIMAEDYRAGFERVSSHRSRHLRRSDR